ncbi:hypothetical protein [Streptomyces sp. NPDC002328]
MNRPPTRTREDRTPCLVVPLTRAMPATAFLTTGSTTIGSTMN